jgi:pyrimidine-nucleoside phosphorylase
MSKKLAGGADAIVLDVKAGSGAFMPTVAAARELAQIMVRIGEDAGRRLVALISNMDEPLGHAVGNALEVKEALAALHGEPVDGLVVPPDFWEHCLTVAAHMVRLAGGAPSLEEARALVTSARDRGEGLARFRAMVAAQGGDVRQVDEPQRLPRAPVVGEVKAERAGAISRIDAGAIGWASLRLGAGREKKGDPIDHAVGFVLPVKVGSRLEKGEPLATIHAAGREALAAAQAQIREAITLSDEQVEPLPLFYDVLGQV